MAARPGARPWALAIGGAALAVRLTPKGGCDAIDGVQEFGDGRPALMVRVRAVPVDGEANPSLIQLVATAVGAPRRVVALVPGATGRFKRLLTSGDGPTLIAALEKIAPPR